MSSTRRAARATLAATAVLATLAWATAPLQANPIAPTFWACDRHGQLREVYVVRDAQSAHTSWFAHDVCTLPVMVGSLVVEMEGDPLTLEGIVQYRTPSFEWRPFALAGTCAPTGPSRHPTREYAGLEPVEGAMFAVGAVPPCGESSLFTLDTGTGAATLVGPTGVPGLEGLAWDATRARLYSLSSCASATPSTLYRLDRATGLATPVGPTGVPGLVSLEFTMGELYAGADAEHGGHLFRLDTATGAATLVTPPVLPVVLEMTGLAATGYGLVIPTQSRSWGRLKTIYR